MKPESLISTREIVRAYIRSFSTGLEGTLCRLFLNGAKSQTISRAEFVRRGSEELSRALYVVAEELIPPPDDELHATEIENDYFK